MKMRVVVTQLRRCEYLEFAPTSWFIRLFLPRMMFFIEQRGHECALIAEINLRIGAMAAWLNRKELDAVREHMRLEGINLKRIVESAA